MSIIDVEDLVIDLEDLEDLVQLEDLVRDVPDIDDLVHRGLDSRCAGPCP